MIETIVQIIMIVIAVGLIAAVLLQKRGSGVGSVFGGVSDSYRSKRGAEKFLYYITIGLAILFAIIPFSLLFVR